jgi:exosortase
MRDPASVDKALEGAGSYSTARPEAISNPAFWQLAILALLVGYLYAGIMVYLVENWWIDPDYSHGFFVPLFVGYVLWQQRKELASVPRSPSWFGLVIIAGALAILIVGVLGAELFLSRTSLLLLVAGLVVHFLGWGHLRKALFAWACLFLMIPIPVIIYNHIAFPLQLFASRVASGSLEFLHVPVLQEGNILQLPAMTLEVAQACSGIRSLLSLVTLAVIYGYFLETSKFRRVLLALSAVPIAIAANGLRLVVTGLLVHYWSPAEAEGFFHAFEGWVIFVLSMVMLFGVHALMRRGKGIKLRRNV